MVIYRFDISQFIAAEIIFHEPDATARPDGPGVAALTPPAARNTGEYFYLPFSPRLFHVAARLVSRRASPVIYIFVAAQLLESTRRSGRHDGSSSSLVA